MPEPGSAWQWAAVALLWPPLFKVQPSQPSGGKSFQPFVFTKLFFQTLLQPRPYVRVATQCILLHCQVCITSRLIYVSSGHRISEYLCRQTPFHQLWGFCSSCFEIKWSLQWTAVDTDLFRVCGEWVAVWSNEPGIFQFHWPDDKMTERLSLNSENESKRPQWSNNISHLSADTTEKLFDRVFWLIFAFSEELTP